MKDQPPPARCPVCRAALFRPEPACARCGTSHAWRLAGLLTNLDQSAAAMSQARADIQSYLRAVRTHPSRPEPMATISTAAATGAQPARLRALSEPQAARKAEQQVSSSGQLPRPEEERSRQTGSLAAPAAPVAPVASAAPVAPAAPPAAPELPRPADPELQATNRGDVFHSVAAPGAVRVGAAAPRGEEEARWGEEERRGEGARRGGERRRVRRLSPQATLLGLGVLLLLAAGATFLAVTWNSLPVTVQAGIMAALALSALAGAVPASRRGLAGTAEALAVLGYGLLAVDFYGARALDLIPAASIDGLPYAGLCCTSVALLNLLLPRLAPKVTTFGIAAVIVSQAPVFLLMVGRASTASLLLALLAQVVGTVLWTAGGTRAVRLTGLSCAALVYAGILIVGPVRVLMGLAGSWTELVTVPPDDLGLESVAGLTPVLATALVVGLAALTGVVLPRRVELAVTPPSPLTECLCAAVAALTAAATLPQLPVGGRWWVTALATGVVLADLLRERRTGVVTAMLSSAAMVVVGLDLMLCLLWRDLLQLGLIAAIVGALALVAYRKHRLPMATVAPVVSIAAQTSIVLLIADGLLSAWSGAMALAVVAAASIGATARWVGLPPERGVLAAAGLAVVLAELAVLPVSALTGTGLVLTIAAAPLVAYGMQPGRRPALLVATLLFGIANTAFVTDAGTTTLEWFTVPPAMLMLTIGLVGWRHRSSWVSLGPGLLLGLVPSALVAGNSPGPVRLVLVVAAAVVVVLLGVRFSLQAPFAVGTQVLAKVALWQLFEVAPLIPRWITLGLAGVIMLAVGASYERRLQEAKQAVRWVGALR